MAPNGFLTKAPRVKVRRAGELNTLEGLGAAETAERPRRIRETTAGLGAERESSRTSRHSGKLRGRRWGRTGAEADLVITTAGPEMVMTAIAKGPARRRHEVSPSRTFILRPVATSLMMLGVVVIGVVAFQQLPVSALPQVDYPTMRIPDVLPRGELGGSNVFDQHRSMFGGGLTQMTSISSFWQLADHAAVFARSQHRYSRAGSTSGHQFSRELSSPRPSRFLPFTARRTPPTRRF